MIGLLPLHPIAVYSGFSASYKIAPNSRNKIVVKRKIRSELNKGRCSLQP